MNPKAYSNAGKDLWTPRWFMNTLLNYGVFPDLDVAACKQSSVAPRWITKAQNTFKTPWDTRSFWLNPPWSDPLPFIQRAIEQIKKRQGRICWILLPGRIETFWFETAHKHALKGTLIIPRLNYFNPRTGKLTTNVNVGSVLFTLTESSCNNPSVDTPYAHLRIKKPHGAKR